jgi:hypothetical protein
MTRAGRGSKQRESQNVRMGLSLWDAGWAEEVIHEIIATYKYLSRSGNHGTRDIRGLPCLPNAQCLQTGLAGRATTTPTPGTRTSGTFAMGSEICSAACASSWGLYCNTRRENLCYIPTPPMPSQYRSREFSRSTYGTIELCISTFVCLLASFAKSGHAMIS